MGTRVEVLSAEDWELRRSLRLAALLDAPGAFGSTYEQSAARTEQEWREWIVGGRVFAAFADDGTACGLVAGGSFPGVTDEGWAYLIAMWVAPPYRGTGAADTLIRAVIDWAREDGRLGVRLEVADGNTRAERLYTRHGFVAVCEPAHRDCDRVMRLAFPLVTPLEPA